VESTKPALGLSSTKYAPVINTFPGADTTLQRIHLTHHHHHHHHLSVSLSLCNPLSNVDNIQNLPPFFTMSITYRTFLPSLPIQGTLFFQQAPKQKPPLKPLTSMSADDHLRKQAHLQRDHLQKMIIGFKILTRPSNTSLISFRNAVASV